jgi:hypothetical protein
MDRHEKISLKKTRVEILATYQRSKGIMVLKMLPHKRFSVPLPPTTILAPSGRGISGHSEFDVLR